MASLPHPALDVAVVGAGPIGCATAAYLLRHGHRPFLWSPTAARSSATATWPASPARARWTATWRSTCSTRRSGWPASTPSLSACPATPMPTCWDGCRRCGATARPSLSAARSAWRRSGCASARRGAAATCMPPAGPRRPPPRTSCRTAACTRIRCAIASTWRRPARATASSGSARPCWATASSMPAICWRRRWPTSIPSPTPPR